jgi:hypothetical protein
MLETIWHFAAPFLGIGVGYVAQRLLGAARWKAVRAAALKLLGDETKPEVNTPQRAVEAALIQAQLDRLAVEAQRVEDAFKLNANGLPKTR